MSVEQYLEEINNIKRNPKYIKLASSHRGELDQKNFDKFRLKLANLQAKLDILQADEKKLGVQTPKSKPAVIRHPVNPAIARVAAEPLPGAKDNTKIIINKSKLAPNRDEHNKIVASNQLAELMTGKIEPEQVDLDIFDDLVFDEEPLPDNETF
jgi:hypothetical protein